MLFGRCSGASARRRSMQSVLELDKTGLQLPKLVVAI